MVAVQDQEVRLEVTEVLTVAIINKDRYANQAILALQQPKMR